MNFFKVRVFLAVGLVLASLSVYADETSSTPKFYSTSLNNVVTHGDSPYTDPSFTKLEDGNLGTLNSLTSADVKYTTTTYPLVASFLFVPLLSKVTVYAYKDTGAGIDIPTSINVNCRDGGTGRSYSYTFKFNPASYTNNQSVPLFC